jgi:hypothetical protein
VLGTFAIIIAIMIVLNAQDNKNKPAPTRQTITTTTVLPAPPPSGGSEPPATPGALPGPDWTDPGHVGDGGLKALSARPWNAALEQNFP